jgi:NTP pyrophosphatase (non-canonical NTP hydrolase)
MEFRELIDRAVNVRKLYTELEVQSFGRSWTSEEIAMGFVGDVGDLMKLVMARNGIRQIPDTQERLAHELADCLWAIIVLANAYEIDLESAFFSTMAQLEQYIVGRLQSEITYDGAS